MKRLYIYLFCIFLSLPTLGQRTQQRIAVGDDFYNKEQYQQAIGVYQRILKNEKQPQVKRELSFKVGESYRRMLNYNEAKKWYTIALNLGYTEADIYMHLSEMTLGLEEFDQAIRYIDQYVELKPNSDIGKKLKQSAYFARENYSTETIFEVSNEARINNPGQQWGAAFMENVAVIYQDQSRVDEQFDIDIRLRYNNIFYWVWTSRTLKEKIVFSSTQPYNGSTAGYSNIYQATFNRRKGDWDTPKLLSGGINSSYYDGFLSYDKQNELAYFMNSGGIDGIRATADIYTVKHNTQNDTWGTPVLFPFNSDEFNIGYPSVSDDGMTLYFASDMPGGFGGYDIYKVLRQEDGAWGEPINLGSDINTAYNDSYPYIAGKVLYFSSYGHAGFGGFDVFYSIIDDEGRYSLPLNMGVPINSSADDFGFIIDENYTRGFLSSNRPGGSGEDDLFSFRVVPKTFTVQGRVTDSETGAPVGGLELYFFDNTNNFFLATTNAQGYYDLPDLSTNVNYFISAYPEGYHELADTLAVKDQLLANRFNVIRDFEKNFTLIPSSRLLAANKPAGNGTNTIADPNAAVIENVIADVIKENAGNQNTVANTDSALRPVIPFTLSDAGFPTIFFDFNRSVLTDEAMAQLDTVIRFLQSNPEKGVIVHAHTDVISGYLFNHFLSQQRAQSIQAHLRKNGIDPARLYMRAYGKTQLAVLNARSDQEHRLNRRATFESIPKEQLQDYFGEASRHSFRYLNSIEKDAYFATGVEFMVQFMASNVPINPQFYKKIMDNVPDTDIIYYYDTDRFHRYLVGSFNNFDAAFHMQRTLRQLGYEIYIVAFHNGERIPVSKARKLAAAL
jgi:outer membrane protein OmpA-like peptidoglycan-associated protein/tetratricopeptide (TPR) repeat protein